MGGSTADATAVALAPVNTQFIGRIFVGAGAACALKGLIWGNLFAISQAMGYSFGEQKALATKAGEAISIPKLKAGFWSRAKVFWPVMVGHTVFFTMYRGSLERDPKNTNKLGIRAMIQPLLVTAIPTIGYAAYLRAPPPTMFATSLMGCVLLHTYDRILHPKGEYSEHMAGGAKNLRRVW